MKRMNNNQPKREKIDVVVQMNMKENAKSFIQAWSRHSDFGMECERKKRKEKNEHTWTIRYRHNHHFEWTNRQHYYYDSCYHSYGWCAFTKCIVIQNTAKLTWVCHITIYIYIFEFQSIIFFRSCYFDAVAYRNRVFFSFLFWPDANCLFGICYTYLHNLLIYT